MKKTLLPFLLLFALTLFNLKTFAQDKDSSNRIISKFDFIPGEKVIFYDDFTTENVGDFPAQWNTNSSGEIVTNPKFPGRWLQMTKGGFFIPEAKEKFTDNFTIEFDLVPMNQNSNEYLYAMDFIVYSGTLDNPNEGGAIPGKAGFCATPTFENVGWSNWSDGGYKGDGSSAFQFNTNEKYHVAFWIQKQRVRMYANEKKILDLPRGLNDGFIYNIFRMQTSDEISPIISNFRIAAGLPDMRNKLLTAGKLISYGIQFDVNSDKVKPVSYATIKEIAQVMKDNPALKIKIIGHTDSDGEDAANLDLSKRRSANVKLELTKTFGIDGSCIETDGKGESQPLVPNENAVNKAKNRRVEFIKI